VQINGKEKSGFQLKMLVWLVLSFGLCGKDSQSLSSPPGSPSGLCLFLLPVFIRIHWRWDAFTFVSWSGISRFWKSCEVTMWWGAGSSARTTVAYPSQRVPMITFFFGNTGAWTQGLHLEPLHSPFFVIFFFFFEIGSRELLAWVGFEPRSFWSLPPGLLGL
jgi:hypothetical protein